LAWRRVGAAGRWRGGAAKSRAAAAQTAPAGELSGPPVLVNRGREPGSVDVTLIAAPARLWLRPGTETEVFAYNGTSPGPTLELLTVQYSDGPPTAFVALPETLRPVPALDPADATATHVLLLSSPRLVAHRRHLHIPAPSTRPPASDPRHQSA